jgi:hypothetical protein
MALFDPEQTFPDAFRTHHGLKKFHTSISAISADAGITN